MNDVRMTNSFSLQAYGLAPPEKGSCQTVAWHDNYVNCKPMYYPDKNPCTVGAWPDRAMIADLNPLQEFVAKDIARIWSPYDYMDGRAAMAQLQWLDVKNASGNHRNKDAPYTRFIAAPDESYCAVKAKNGGKVPAFLAF